MLFNLGFQVEYILTPGCMHFNPAFNPVNILFNVLQFYLKSSQRAVHFDTHEFFLSHYILAPTFSNSLRTLCAWVVKSEKHVT